MVTTGLLYQSWIMHDDGCGAVGGKIGRGESASELYRPSNRHLSTKVAPILRDRGCHMVSVTDPYGRILGFIDRSRYFSIK
jgi:hypothetical protein